MLQLSRATKSLNTWKKLNRQTRRSGSSRFVTRPLKRCSDKVREKCFAIAQKRTNNCKKSHYSKYLFKECFLREVGGIAFGNFKVKFLRILKNNNSCH